MIPWSSSASDDHLLARLTHTFLNKTTINVIPYLYCSLSSASLSDWVELHSQLIWSERDGFRSNADEVIKGLLEDREITKWRRSGDQGTSALVQYHRHTVRLLRGRTTVDLNPLCGHHRVGHSDIIEVHLIMRKIPSSGLSCDHGFTTNRRTGKCRWPF